MFVEGPVRVVRPGDIREETMKDYQMLIDGKWEAAKSGKTLDALDPASEETIARFPAGGPADVDRAVAAAKKAYHETWRGTTAQERGRILLTIVIALHDVVLDQVLADPTGRLSMGDAYVAALRTTRDLLS